MLGGVVSVSQFVQGYLRHWAPPGTFTGPSEMSLSDVSSSGRPFDVQPSSGALPSHLRQASDERPSDGSPSFRMLVVPLSAWNCFGSPPFPDYGALAASRLALRSSGAPQAEERPGGNVGVGASKRKTVGVMKLTPEKGCCIVMELARKMPHLDFVAVAGDPDVSDSARGIPNLEVRRYVSFHAHVEEYGHYQDIHSLPLI